MIEQQPIIAEAIELVESPAGWSIDRSLGMECESVRVPWTTKIGIEPGEDLACHIPILNA